MNRIKPWVLASRPKTLFATLAPIIIALSLSYQITSKINWLIASMTFLAAILLQIGSNYANDAYDFIKGADNDTFRVGPKRMSQAGVLKPDSILNMMYFIFIISVLRVPKTLMFLSSQLFILKEGGNLREFSM